MITFQEFPKIPRYKREVCITEKIDGTNAAVVWAPYDEEQSDVIAVRNLVDGHGNHLGAHALLAQSRNRFLVPNETRKGGDNFGFAAWVSEHTDELTALGPGVHYGEWWGAGIQRGYGQAVKRFSLFNVARWSNESRPACCDVVPVLRYGPPSVIDEVLEELRTSGSKAAPGFMQPEGVIVWHSQSRQYYKILLEGDDVPKNQSTKHKVQKSGGAQSSQESSGQTLEA